MNKLALSALVLAALSSASCNLPEQDGRKYQTNPSPVQGKMGVSFKRVYMPPTAASEAAADEGNKTNEPAGLLDRNEKPDEPGAKYWMHAQQSANPVQGKMGVVVRRVKKD